MADENSLDDFLNIKMSAENEQPQEKQEKNVDIEDEFAKLLNDFISQDAKTAAPAVNSGDKDGLDSLVTTNKTLSQKDENIGLDEFLNAANPNNSTASDFISDKTAAPSAETSKTDQNLDVMANSLSSSTEKSSSLAQEEDSSPLKQEERELSRAITNFQDGVTAMAEKKNLKMPETDYEENQLIPNYKPSIGKKIAVYMLACWDIIEKCDPQNIRRLSKDASDEEYLSFAESLNDTDMQLAIISYVEILINLEICEVNYEQKKEIARKNKIKKELYEEYMALQERKNLFARKLKEKNFPIDVDKLIGNYFRAAQKDATGSFEALTKNPAMFAPIEMDKIRPKFFGLIKVTGEDGIKANQKIGSFIKKLKV